MGYAIFAVGSMLQQAGYEVGLPSSVPGGLFKVAVGCYLMVTGFSEVASQHSMSAYEPGGQSALQDSFVDAASGLHE